MSEARARPASCEVVITRSGAPAIRDRASGEIMHPVVGPRLEAATLYLAPSRLAARLAAPEPAPLVLYDVGLGAGSNAIAAWRCAAASGGGRRLELVSFERDLAALELALTEGAAFDLDGEAGEAARALRRDGHHAAAHATWRLITGELPATLAAAPRDADVVFWDPFSPRANPALWTVATFAALRARCRPGATVHTYSASTTVRAALLLAGFAVGLGAASGGKLATTVAATSASDLAQPLEPSWLARLARSSAPLPSDAPGDALERIRAAPQFAR